MYTRDDEDDLLLDIEEGVELALGREGLRADRVDPITFNKLAYFAITEYEVPISFGWYKYGPAPVDVKRAEVDIEPRSTDEVAVADEPRLGSGTFRSPEEYSYFFSEDLDEFERMLETPTKEYLIGFYFEHAPDRYRDLYVASAELQQTLDTIADDPDWHDAAESHLEDLERRYARVVSETALTPTLEEAVGPVRDYGALLADVVTAATARSRLAPTQQRFLERVVGGFYSGAWNYVALLIARDTVDESPGTNQRVLRNGIEDDLRELRNEYDARLERMEERAAEFDLLPDDRPSRFAEPTSVSDRSVPDGEFDESDTASMDDLQSCLEE